MQSDNACARSPFRVNASQRLRNATQSFGEIFVLTQGGGGSNGIATTTLPYYIYEQAQQAFNVSQAAAAGVIVVIATEIVATITLRLLSSLFRASEAMG